MPDQDRNEPLRVLFLCTRNSARSQIAEALLRLHGGDRFIVASAGTEPAEKVHPAALDVIEMIGGDPTAHHPKSCDKVADQGWDIVITVCDRARETCPRFPGRPAVVHWGMEDPAAIADDDAGRRAFRDTMSMLRRRIDILAVLPVEKLEHLALQQQIESITCRDEPTER